MAKISIETIVSAAFLGDGNTIQVVLGNGLRPCIPDDHNNADRGRLQEWIEAGNAINPYVPPVPTASEKIAAALVSSETAGQVARGLEDVIDHLANGTPLPARAVDWALDRASKRAGAAG